MINKMTDLSFEEVVEHFLVQLVTQAAFNARDRTFKTSDIPNMASNMAHNFMPEVIAAVEELVEGIIGEDEEIPEHGLAQRATSYAKNQLRSEQRQKFRAALHGHGEVV